MPTRYPSQEQTTEAVLAFINARTWTDRKQIVEAQHDMLLTDAAEQLMVMLLDQYRGDEEVTEMLQECRVLLSRCRSQGIDAAFADRLHTEEMQNIQHYLMQRLQEVRSEEELRELLDEHPELLPILQHMATQAQASQGSPVSLPLPDELHALLQELESPPHLSDMPHRIQVCQAALTLVDRAQQPELWAALQNELGNSLAQNPREERADNLEAAIAHYQQALRVYTPDVFPAQWARTQMNLGNAYGQRLWGERAANLEQAIACYEQALRVYTSDASPAQWAWTLVNLGVAYGQRLRGERAANLEQAIACYEQALRVYTPDASPEDWAMTQHNLGNAYVDLSAAVASLDQDLEAPEGEAPLPSVPEAERRINVWVSERPDGSPEPLRLGDMYTLNVKVGQAVQTSLVSGPEAMVPDEDVPEQGLVTAWVVTSRTVELVSPSPDMTFTVATMDYGTLWTARFTLHIPQAGDSSLSQLSVIPRVAAEAGLEILIYVRQELYRQFSVKLAVAEALDQRVTSGETATICNDLLHAPMVHINLRTPHEWTTPPGETSIAVFGQNAYAKGEDGVQFLDQLVLWYGAQAVVAGPLKNVRDTAERFRAKWENYLNDIDPADLRQRLAQWTPAYTWGALGDLTDSTHHAAWQAVQVSAELRDLAYDGHRLYEAFFPEHSPLRGWLDSLTPGHRLNLSWLPTSGAGWIPHIPWGLMYLPDVPAPGEPVDPMGFWALRFRLGYTAHEVQAGSKALGSPQTSYGGHLFYWGDQPNDVTRSEADWQRQQWRAWQNQVCIPALPATAHSKHELLKALDTPGPSPMAVLYFFCQCSVGAGNDPVLRFGSTLQMSDVIRRTELGTKTLSDRPLVFANACTTAATDPYLANELEEGFFQRGCRAYLGTETKVPIQFASRFALIFFHFFYRQAAPQPMAAGEAVAQTRLFLWTTYRNIGSIFYAYINQYELFLADDNEVVALRY